MAASKKAQLAALKNIRSSARRVQLGPREDGKGSTEEALISLRLMPPAKPEDEDEEETTIEE